LYVKAQHRLGTFEAYLSSGKFESNFPLQKYARISQMCAALNGCYKKCG